MQTIVLFIFLIFGFSCAHSETITLTCTTKRMNQTVKFVTETKKMSSIRMALQAGGALFPNLVTQEYQNVKVNSDEPRYYYYELYVEVNRRGLMALNVIDRENLTYKFRIGDLTEEGKCDLIVREETVTPEIKVQF